MFKAQVLQRNFSLFNRVPYSRIVQSAARDGHDTVTIQRVYIRKPIFSKSRFVGAVAIAGATYGLGRYIGIEVEVEEIKDEKHKSTRSTSQNESSEDQNDEPWQEVGDEEKDEEEYDEALLFLPTGFSRPRPPTFYKGTDPEWQEYKNIVTDRARVEKIRAELAALIRGVAARSPSYVSKIGQIDTSKGNVWIEIKIPDGPPVEYERPGIELTEELGWRKATRAVEDLHHLRLNRVLLPTEVANALYQDTKRKAKLSWKDFRIYMGWEEKSEPDTVQQIVQRVGATRVVSTTTAKPDPLSTSPANDTQQPAASPSAAPVGGLAKDMGFVLPDPKKLTLDLSQFRQDFRRAFKPYQTQTPRGHILVLGMIEVIGERARMTLNVAATYDPKQGRYVGLQASLWNFSVNRQAPRGGP